MATISTAPTPFDQVSKEELNDWLGHPVTNKLLAALKQRVAEADAQLVYTDLCADNATIGSQVRTILIARADREQIIEWIQGAHRG